MNPKFTLIYEDGPCLVVYKPPGLLTQAPPGIDSLEVQVKAFLAARCAGEEMGTGTSRPSEPVPISPPARCAAADHYLGLPHRLDRPASGALLLATDLRTTRKLGQQFEYRKVRKVYWACVAGRVANETGTWEDHVYKIPGEPRAEVVPPGHPEGRRAVLHYRVLRAADWGTWLEIELETGRTHQIRIQAASRGHPVLGDAQYGSTVPFGPQYDDWRLRAIALHARSISFRHPVTRQIVTVEAPVAEYWPAPPACGFAEKTDN